MRKGCLVVLLVLAVIILLPTALVTLFQTVFFIAMLLQ